MHAESHGQNRSRIYRHSLVETHTEPRQWLILGEPRVNVLSLNLAFDGVVR